MKISRFGGLIAAASKKAALPMLKVGSITIIKRIVISFQQAGIFPIVVITGANEDEVKYQLSNYGVIFLSYEQTEQLEMLDCIKHGLRYLQGKCDRVAFTPVNVPMFTPDTLIRLKNTNADIVIPSCHGKGGHPVMLSEQIFPDILNYNGPDGLRGAIRSLKENTRKEWFFVQREELIHSVPVDDEGVTIYLDTPQDYETCRQNYEISGGKH